MAFALLFTAALTVILLIGSLIIYKSKLPANDKMISLIIILALFGTVSIVNEAKRASSPRTVSKALDFDRGFFNYPTINKNVDYKLPQVEEPTEVVRKSLGNWNPATSQHHPLAFLYSGNKQGATLAFKEYTHLLLEQGNPALYLQLGHADFNLFDFSNALRIHHVDSINEAVKKLNNMGKVPSIFIDNAHNALSVDPTLANGFVCTICKYLISLYDANKVNIVMISNDVQARELLRSDPVYSSKFSFHELRELDNTQVEEYILYKVNPYITEDSKKFTPENIALLLSNLGWNFDLLDEYVKHTASYKNVEDFVHSKVDGQSKRLAALSHISDILTPLVTVTEQTKDNAWIPYSRIRRVYEGNPTKKLEDAINAHVLVKENSSYRFANATVYNAMLTAKQNKLLI